VFVGGLPQGATEAMLEQEFRAFGELSGVQLVMRSTTKHRGFAYIRFQQATDADALLAASPLVAILGKRLDLRQAEGFVSGQIRSGRPNRRQNARARVLAPGVVRLEGFLKLEEQQRLADIVVRVCGSLGPPH